MNYNNLQSNRTLLITTIVILFILISSWEIVPAGYKGVRLRFGAVTGQTVNEGVLFKLPFAERIVKINIQTQKIEIDADAASSDLQTVNVKIALNYNVEAKRVGEIYQDIGLGFEDKIIRPSLEESVKAVTAKYTAEQLISKRGEVNGAIYDLIKSKLQNQGIQIQGLNIVNFNFSESFNKAIEDKVTAEQNALAAKNKLQQVQFEAEQKIAEAKGKAEALRVESQAISQSTDVIQLRMIEKWNGVLPQYVGSTNPFVSLR